MGFGVDLRKAPPKQRGNPSLFKIFFQIGSAIRFKMGRRFPKARRLVPAQGLFFPKIGKKDQAVSNRCFLSGAVKETT